MVVITWIENNVYGDEQARHQIVAENRDVAYFIKRHPQTDKESIRVYLNGVCLNEEMGITKYPVGSLDHKFFGIDGKDADTIPNNKPNFTPYEHNIGH